MTEAEWLTGAQSRDLVQHLRRRKIRVPSARKWRLFACACCRSMAELMEHDDSPWKVEIGERHADQLATQMELTAAYASVNAMGRFVAFCWHVVPDDEIRFATYTNPIFLLSHTRNVTAECGMSGMELMRAESQAQSILARCVFGNPFRDSGFRHDWRTSDVVALAKYIYEERAFDRLPILADALQDAGCDNEAILNHCRDENGLHARGCWVVDLALGKT